MFKLYIGQIKVFFCNNTNSLNKKFKVFMKKYS